MPLTEAQYQEYEKLKAERNRAHEIVLKAEHVNNTYVAVKFRNKVKQIQKQISTLFKEK